MEQEAAEAKKPDPDPLTEVMARIDALGRTTGERMARLEGRLEATPPQPVEPAERPKELTRAELRAAVEEGRLTQDEMEDLLDARRERRLAEKMDKALEARDAARDRNAAAEAALAPYLEKHPDIKVEGSENRAKVAAEYTRLVRELGLPDSKATEVCACQNVFGPAKNLAERKRETSQEAGADAGGHEEPAGKERWEKGLTQGQIDGFRYGIATGGYKGPDDPFFKAVVERARAKNKGTG